MIEDSSFVLDTHVWLWLMDGDERIPPPVVSALEHAATFGGLYICSLSVWEIAALVSADRVRFGIPLDQWLAHALETPGLNVVELNSAVAVESSRLPREFSGDLVDGIILSTARVLGAQLVTADHAMAAFAADGFARVTEL